MIDTYHEMIDMQISHSQLHIYSGDYIESNAQWGKGNVDQGAVLHDSHLIFDPIIQEPFKAKIYIKLSKSYEKNINSLRSISSNLQIQDNAIYFFSVPGTQKLSTKFENGNYNVYFEECESEEVDELFFVITFIKSEEKVSSQYLQSDPWGGEEGKKLQAGIF